MKTTYYVYAISHKVTGKWYIGSRIANGCHPEELFRTREKYIEGKSKGYRKGYFTSSKYVKRLIKLDGGIKNFKVESVKIFDTKEKVLLCEALLHRLFDLKNDNEYLNQINAGEKFNHVGRTHSEETRKKMRDSHKGKFVGENHPLYGKKHSDETRRKISESQKGKKLSDETRRKISESHKGKQLSDETRRKMSLAKKNMSDETRKKMSESHKGKPQQIITCPHCNKTGGVSNMQRWHFDNCKSHQQ
ncbi:NUMOD3 motif-containing protein [Nitrosomonas nitrosa]|uniref:NUMOD3 domain-containing DNA-binding protein n=1 Tax=Nitrosomonas nitrosa TaxID=52442 RepID=UPI000D31FE6B|nr:NUMOD3 domain-containing DNA-binding protein [Nitrosomonas nitrosa]PTR04958.1 NUMOD3 motif-containing protein [Nitrosomonas nitrosa]